MDIFVVVLILGSALFHSVWNILIKDGPDQLLETTLNTNGGAFLALLFLPFLPLPAPDSLLYLLPSCLIQGIYCVFLALAYKSGDFTLAYTLMRGSAPLMTVAATAFLPGQGLSGGGLWGVGILSLGILTLALDAARRGKASGLGSRREARAAGYALAGAATIMGYTVLDGMGVRLSGHVFSYICWGFFLCTLPITAFALAVRGRAYGAYVKTRWKQGLAGGACSIAAYGTSVWAMSFAPIALVAALRESSVIFGMLLAVFFLRERFTPARATAVLLVACGAVGMRLWA